MKKLFTTIGCVMACVSILAGCSEKAPDPTEEFKTSFTQEESASTEETVAPETNDENTLVFGEQTYNDSIQINQNDLGWATYDSIPNDIFLFNTAFFPCDSICQMPDWDGMQVIDNVAVSQKDNNIIAVSIVSMSELNSSQSVVDEVMNLMQSNYGVTSFNVTETIVDEADYQYWSIVQGSLNNQENMKYIMKSYNDGQFGYVLYAAWDENDIYTQERMEQTLSDIRLSFNLYPLGPEEDISNTDIPVE